MPMYNNIEVRKYIRIIDDKSSVNIILTITAYCHAKNIRSAQIHRRIFRIIK